MNERLLQFIWQFRYFNRQPLQLTDGEHFQVIYPGVYNTNQGPDFLNAKIRIGNTLWAGHVELHVKTSDWYRHAHQHDRNYDNVVLHVVWQDDMPGKVGKMPVFELCNLVPKLLLQHYEEWMQSQSYIPCGRGAGEVDEIIWISWKERLVIERLQRKASIIFAYLLENRHHWDETCWWLLARNFGIVVNTDAFESIARSLPLSLLARHKNQVIQLEALLMGQAGLLNEKFVAHYPIMLQKEYRFLQKKYNLQPICERVHFLRMRPSAFPTIRLAQLAMLIHSSAHLFSVIRETESMETLRQLFSVTANDFWHYHYNFSESAGFKPKKLGETMVDNVIINTVVPLLFAYGRLHKEDQYTERALQWLRELASEKNTITFGFSQLCIANKNAFDSQALKELKTNYCDERRCLDCAVGNALLKNSAKHSVGNS
jgi:hypothetical protein